MANPTTMPKLKVLLVDDSTMFRTSMKLALAAKANLEIVGEAADAFEARDKIRELKPDVLVMDIVMPKMDGLTFLRQLMGQYTLTCILISGTDSS
ncbi:MAG: response regulator, partial [Ruminiclostridium sp.]|nr:response regulator [Ruminiclostridium sp.]